MLWAVTSWQRVLTLMFIAQLLTAVGFSMIFPFLPLYIEHLGVSSSFGSLQFWVGMAFSAQAITMMFASPIWGALADRYGRKRMVERAMYGGAIIIFLMAFATSAEMLVVLRAIQGLVTGVVAASSALVAATAPRKRTGYAMGVLQVGLWSGVAVGPIIGGVMKDLIGFEAAFIVTAVLLVLGGLLVTFGVKENFVPKTKRKGRGAFFGDWKHVFGAPGVTSVFIIRFVGWLGRNIIIPFAPLFVATLLVNQNLVGTITGLMIGLASAAGTASAIYLGRLGDRIGHRSILIVCSLIAAVFYLPQALVANAWQLIALQAVTGAAMGGIMPSLSALLNRYTEPGEEGAVYGLDNSIVAGARAVAPLAGASIVAATVAILGTQAGNAAATQLGYRWTFVATGLMFFVTAALAWWRLHDNQPAVNRSTKSAPAPGD